MSMWVNKAAVLALMLVPAQGVAAATGAPGAVSATQGAAGAVEAFYAGRGCALCFRDGRMPRPR